MTQALYWSASAAVKQRNDVSGAAEQKAERQTEPADRINDGDPVQTSSSEDRGENKVSTLWVKYEHDEQDSHCP